MKKIKKIKIKINGKFSTINENLSLSIFLKELKIPLKKVAIELNLPIPPQHLIEKTLILHQSLLFFLNRYPLIL